MPIGVEVGGVRLPDALTMGVDDLVRTVDHTHAGELEIANDILSLMFQNESPSSQKY